MERRLAKRNPGAAKLGAGSAFSELECRGATHPQKSRKARCGRTADTADAGGNRSDGTSQFANEFNLAKTGRKMKAINTSTSANLKTLRPPSERTAWVAAFTAGRHRHHCHRTPFHKYALLFL